MKPKDCFDALEEYVYSKYADLMLIDGEKPLAPRKAQHLMDKIEDGVSLEKLKEAAKKLNTCELEAFCDEIRLYVSNEIGNLIETYRYKSVEEGQQLEQYLDWLLEITSLSAPVSLRHITNVDTCIVV